VRQALDLAAAVEGELPQVDVARALVVLAVTFDERELAVGEDAFGLVVLIRGVGKVGDLFRRDLDAADVGALVA